MHKFTLRITENNNHTWNGAVPLTNVSVVNAVSPETVEVITRILLDEEYGDKNYYIIAVNKYYLYVEGSL